MIDLREKIEEDPAEPARLAEDLFLPKCGVCGVATNFPAQLEVQLRRRRACEGCYGKFLDIKQQVEAVVRLCPWNNLMFGQRKRTVNIVLDLLFGGLPGFTPPEE